MAIELPFRPKNKADCLRSLSVPIYWQRRTDRTWSDRGRKPCWIVNALAQVKQAR
jgi:DNA-binding protein H-NS